MAAVDEEWKENADDVAAMKQRERLMTHDSTPHKFVAAGVRGYSMLLILGGQNAHPGQKEYAWH